MSTRQYELVYIVNPEASEAEVDALHVQVEGIVSKMSGTLERTEPWGKRKLAYEIGPHKEGTYVLEVFSGSAELIKELDRRLKVNDAIIRHLIVRVDEELSVAERTRTRRQEETTRRRLARGLPAEPGPGERTERGDRDRDEGQFDLEG